MSIGRCAHVRLAVVVGLFAFWVVPLWAAEEIDPAARLQDLLRRAERAAPAPSAPLERPVQPLPLPDGPVIKGQIELREVLFSPSQLLSNQQLTDVVQPYIGRSVGSEELNALLRDIQALYLAMGVQSAVPVVPAQDLQTGVLKIALVEGTLGDIKWGGSLKPDRAWLKPWFDFKPGEVIRPEPLARSLALFNASSDFSAEGQYVSGTGFGTSDLEVTVNDAPSPQYWALAELPAVGSGRTLGNSLIVGFRHYPVSSVGGRIDGMVIQGPTATTLSLSGGLPLGQQGWRLGASASASRSRTVVASTESDKSDLTIEGASSVLSLDLTQHLYLLPGRLWKLSGSLTQIHSHSQAAGATLSDRKVQRFSLSAATDWLVDNAGAERGTFRASLNEAQGQANSFGYAEVSGTWAYRLAGPAGPVFRTQGQMRWLNKRQPDVSDLWLAGGSATVRGFDAGAISGRSGQALQLALYQRLPWSGVDSPEAFVFSDHARARTANGDSALRIGSAGVGLQFQIDRRWAIETVWSRQTHGFQGSRTRALLRASASW
jgi:hemolysin activation/secretion protein